MEERRQFKNYYERKEHATRIIDELIKRGQYDEGQIALVVFNQTLMSQLFVRRVLDLKLEQKEIDIDKYGFITLRKNDESIND